MPNVDKFLEVAIQMGKISDNTRRFVLDEQIKLRRRGDIKRVGDILVENSLVDSATREEIHHEQERRRPEQRSRIRRPRGPSVIGLQFLVALLALIGVIIAHFSYDVHLDAASAIAAFTVFIVCTAIEYFAERSATKRSLPVAAYKVGKFFVLLLMVLLVLYSVYCLNNISDIISLHPDSDSKNRVAVWLSRFEFAFVTLVLAVCLLLVYAAWKFFSQRYVEARMGALKDIIIRVESTLRDKVSPGQRQNASIDIVLKGLRNMLRLSSWDRVRGKLRFYRKTAGLITVAYLEPEEEHKGFRIVDVAFPEKAPDRALEAFTYLRDNYHPAFLNEETFEYYKKQAKGKNPKEWKERYLNFTGRSEYISACGWIFAKRETLLSKDALACLAFDNSFIDDLKQRGYSSKELVWLEVHSFIGCPVFASDNNPAGVLLALKNVPSGFVPEDLESAIIASQIIGRILQR